VSAVVVSAQHAEEVSDATLHAEIKEHVVRAVVPPELLRPRVDDHSERDAVSAQRRG
jgi:S-adenosylmethionine synthetase